MTGCELHENKKIKQDRYCQICEKDFGWYCDQKNEKEIISHSRAVLAGIYSYQDTTGISKDKPWIL